MNVELLSHTPLWVAAKAIRKCWSSEDKSDTDMSDNIWCPTCHEGTPSCGPKDKELIDRVGNKFKHASTLEHLVYTFDIDGISRSCLQELARHRMASLSVKSTRYTLKELKNSLRPVDDYLVPTGNYIVDDSNWRQLNELQEALQQGISNDKAKYMIPESYKTSLVWTINARSLQNFLQLRTSKSALWEIRDLAYELYNQLPEEHKYLFSDSLYKDTK